MPIEQKQSKLIVKTRNGYLQLNPETSIDSIDGLQTALNSAVHKTGDETIAGAKTFSSEITGDISGNAGTADAFSESKSVTLTGDVTGTASSTGGWSVAATLTDSGVAAGTYKSVTVDAKGRVTDGTNPSTLAGYGITDANIANGVVTLGGNAITPLTAASALDATKLTGTVPLANLPAGALERLVPVLNQTARFALTSSDVQIGDTVQQQDTGVLYYVVDVEHLDSAAGYVEYTAGSATSVPWSGVTGKPESFTPAAHSHAGTEVSLTGYEKPQASSAVAASDTVNAAIGKIEKALDGKAGAATTLAGYGISDASISNGVITLGSDTITPLTATTNLDAAKLTGTASIDTTGNAATATKATEDASGNVITATYATKTELNGKANSTHSHAGTEVTLTGYEKPQASSAVAAADTVNAAIGKLEKALDGKADDSGVVHTTGAEAVDGIKTFEKNTMAEAVALTGSAIDVSTSSFFTKTISADTTFTFTGAPSGKSCAFTLILTNGGAANVAWPVNINWMGGQAPTLKETGIDVLTFFTVNGGTTWLEVSGSISGGSGSGSIADSGVIAGTYGPSANVSGTYSGTFIVPEISVNQKGQVTQVIDRVVTLPASDNTDISVQVVENGWTKSYLLGVDAANQVSGVPLNVTAIADKDVYMTGSPGVLHATTFEGALSGNAATATKATNDVDNNPIKTTYAKLASPALTGTPTAPTAAAGTNTTQIATTEFVANALSGFTPSGGSGAKEIQYSTVEPTTSTVSALDDESLIFYEDSSMSGSFNGSYVVPANYIGATSSASGVAGLVPPATSTERDYYLKGDGTWAAASGGSGGSVADYVGATSSASGTHGLVPAATSAERDSYLKGDGTWGSIALPSTYVGATSNASGTAGLVPAAASSDTAKFLQGDGAWTDGVHLSGNETISGAKTFAQGPYGTTAAVSASEINLANGTVFTKTVSADTTFTITGAPSGKAASFSLILTNAGAYAITWPASVKWAGGNVPSLAQSGVDLLTFLTPDGGTTWYGVLSAGGAA